MKKITPFDIENLLAELLENGGSPEEIMGEISDINHNPIQIRSFEEKGILSRDRGLVLRVGNNEFQITIIRSGS